MNRILILLFPLLLFGLNPFEPSDSGSLKHSTHKTDKSKKKMMSSKNTQIRCRCVCDKRAYKEQKISDAVLFYKNNKEYTFSGIE